MAKNIHFGEDGLTKLMEGVEILTKAVQSTLGPRGRIVLMRTNFEDPHGSKDGVTVAKEIELADPLQDLGAQIVKKAAERTADLVGDGTTTSTVLAHALLTEGNKYLKAGVSPINLKRGIDTCVAKVASYIKDRTITIDQSNQDKILDIATISANSDKEIGAIVAEAFKIATVDGAIAVDDSGTQETYLETVTGFEFDRGYMSSQLVNNEDTKSVELDDTLVLLIDKKVASHLEIQPILEQIYEQYGDKSVLIVANDFGPHAIKFVAYQKINKVFSNIALVKSPSYGERQRDMLEDLAILTGAVVVSDADGIVLKDIDLSYLGTAERAVVTKTNTTVYGGGGFKEEIDERINALIKDLNAEEKEYMKPFIQERIGKMRGGVAVIRVGGSTGPEIKEKKDRIDDALNASRVAIKEGIVPGGGYILVKAAQEIDLEDGLPEEQKFGAKVVRAALYSPFRVICENAGVSPDAILAKLESADPGLFYNAATGEIEDLIESGVIDPAAVPKIALFNAASVAGLLLMTDVTITNDENELDLSQPPMTPF